MRHFYRSHTTPADVLVVADRFFSDLGLTLVTTTARTRQLTGPLGAMKLSVRAEGGHYTFVEVVTDQMGESRLDRNVKRFFVQLHRADDPSHTLEAAY
jgi:hypothetical protein